MLKKIITKITAIISFICLLTNITLSISAQGAMYVYNPILQEMGITEEIFWGMPVEQRNIYQEIVSIQEISTDTKFYKEVSSLNRAISTPVLLEINQSEYRTGISTLSLTPIEESDDTTTGSWYKMTTIISKVETINGGIKYYITNTVDLDGSLFSGFDKSCYIGTSINANMSPVRNSEYFRLLCTLGVSGQQIIEDKDDVTTHKSAGGIAFDYIIGGMMVSAQAFMSVEVEKNVSNVTVFDGYGLAGYWQTTVNPSISIGSGGASISISPQKTLTRAQDTHVQIKP